MITGFASQDTIKPQLVIKINPGNLIPDSVFRRLDEVPEHIRKADSAALKRKIKTQVEKITISDTTSVCSRNSVADLTFADPESFLKNPEPYPQGQFPYQLYGKVSGINQNKPVIIIKSLKEGNIIHEKPLQSDWITGLLFLSALLWLIVKTTTRGMVPELTRFVMYRGFNESSQKDTGSLFYWQSTILNFVAFLVLSLFAYCNAEYNELIPSGFPHFAVLLIFLGCVIIAVTLRHFICVVAGNLSGQNDLFNEYLMTVYQSYRLASIFIFIITVLIVFTVIFSPIVFMTSGYIILGIFYFFRIYRLLLIFMKRNFSVLYLFLYLCALEILPALIIIKYLSVLLNG